MSGVEGTADGARAWREQLAQKGTRLLDLLKERPRPNAEWEVRAHGALIDVETKNDDLVDRVVLVVQRDAHQTPDDFRVSVEGRLDRLDRYLQATNSGRVVRRLMLENLCGVSVMRRRGPDPSTVGISWPPFSTLPLLVARVGASAARQVAAQRGVERASSGYKTTVVTTGTPRASRQ